jgi:hypothetical protein
MEKSGKGDGYAFFHIRPLTSVYERIVMNGHHADTARGPRWQFRRALLDVQHGWSNTCAARSHLIEDAECASNSSGKLK